MINYKIANIMIMCQCTGTIDLEEINNNILPCKYRSKRYSAITIKFENPRGTCNIFSSGCIVVLGSKTINGGYYILARLTSLLNLKVANVEVVNMVATLQLPTKLDIVKIRDNHPSSVMCDPELFPSANYRKPDSAISASIFNSGKVNVYGCKSCEEINICIEELVNKITIGAEIDI